MVEYRHFQNADPPLLRRLWHECGLGRGAALEFDADVFETCVFSQPYFDPRGLILAIADGQAIGYIHAGFRASPDQSQLDRSEGVICVVMVLPQFRRQGIGRELVRRAEAYLRESGAQALFAGPAHPRDPFYFGLYGGSQPAGFLESDPLVHPFLRSLGYTPIERRLVFQRELGDKPDPVGLRLISLRRSTRLTSPETPTAFPWWWQTRPGRLDSLELALAPKTGNGTLARVTVVGLDFYLPRWRQRAIGLQDLSVPEPLRRKGYGQALLVEVCRRVKSEMIQLVEAHVIERDQAVVDLLKSAGFEQVDAGVVYRKESTATAHGESEVTTIEQYQSIDTGLQFHRVG
jgi:ribosomal protein S18 acetylase RimI-like enzyme